MNTDRTESEKEDFESKLHQEQGNEIIFIRSCLTREERELERSQAELDVATGALHVGVTCDTCDGPVRGIRFKCMACYNFDLCSDCEKQGKHSQHAKRPIADPSDRTWLDEQPKLSRYTPMYITGKRFCLNPKQTALFTCDSSNGCITLIDLYTGKVISECHIKQYKLTNNFEMWLSIEIVEPVPMIMFLLALVSDQNGEQYFLLSFRIFYDEHLANIRITLEKHVTICEEMISEKGNFNRRIELIKDEKDQIFCVVLCRTTEKPFKTKFRIAAIIVDDCGEIQQKTITNGISIDGHWSRPFIANYSIGFLHANEEDSQLIQIPLSSLTDHRIIRRSISHDKYDKFPFCGLWSNSCMFGDLILYNVFDKNTKSAELWAIDTSLSCWKKFLTISEHAVVDGRLVVTQNGRIFMLGFCVEHSVCEKTIHDYQPVFHVPVKKDFLNIYQLSAFHSPEKIQIIYALNQHEQTTVLLMKALETINFSSEKSDVFIYVIDEKIRYRYVIACSEAFDTSFDSTKYIICFEKGSFPGLGTAENDCTLIIDNLHSLSFDEKQWLQERKGRSLIALSNNIEPGLDQPRNRFAWHESMPASFQNRGIDMLQETNRYVECCSIADTSKELKRFENLSKDAMDQFYPDWMSESFQKKTVCIPASLDLNHNRYHGPSDANADGYDDSRFMQKRTHFYGQIAEDAFLHSFQKLEIGGILVHGFDTNEYARLRRMESRFRKWNISPVEIDFMFLHFALGIFVIEVKGTQQENLYREAPAFKKAIKQLNKTKELISILFENLTNTIFDLPIHCIACFPFATIQQRDKKDEATVHFIDESLINDAALMKRMFLGNTPQNVCSLVNVDALKKFACLIAGYRSVDFMSAEFNALSVHKMFSNQSFITNTSYTSCDGVFLTKEQQTIIECMAKHQIISGPPGTGKTMIILSKVMQAVTLEKAGRVLIITSKEELNVKFRKFFESRNSTAMLRFPIIDNNWRAEVDDDVFIDEAYFGLPLNSFLKERLNASGLTIVALTGFYKPMQIMSVEETLAELGMMDYRYFPMKTVIRNTAAIFNEWKSEYSQEIPFYLGHSISGQIVSRHQVKWLGDALETLLAIVLQYIPQIQDESKTRAKQSDHLIPNHLCIITDDISCDIIKSFLVTKRIACGSVKEQLFNPSFVAVANFNDTMSFEWPVVIMMSLESVDYGYPFALISSSRCIARLIIIERNYLAIQDEIDKKLMSLSSNFHDLPFSIFRNIVSDTVLSFKNSPSYVLDLAFIRHNYLPLELKCNEHFKGCRTMFESLEKIPNNDAICQILFNEELIRHDIKCFVEGKWSMNIKGDLPKVLIRLWGNVNEQGRFERWNIAKKLVEKLAGIYESASANTDTLRNRKENFLSLKNRHDDDEYMWFRFVRTIGTFLHICSLKFF